MWIGLASVLAVLYASYLMVRFLTGAGPKSIASPHPAGAPAAHAAPAAPPVPLRPPAPAPLQYARRPMRNRAEQIRLLLSKSPRQQLTEVLGSMLLSALVAAALCVVMGLFLPENNPEWNQLVWLGIVATLGAWGVIIPSKFWETRDGEPTMRRFVLLLIGLGVGLLAYSVDTFLLAEPRWGLLEIPRSAAEGYQSSLLSPSGAANLKGYFAYFAFLFPVLRWWKQADPLRPARLGLWPILCVASWAWVLYLVWPFPQPWGVMVAVATSVAVQLSTPWISFEERRRVGLPLTREE
jgi:hypothetical protein